MSKIYPEEWKYVPFGRFISSVQNGYGRRPTNEEYGPIVLRLADVSQGIIDVSNVRRVEMPADEFKKYCVKYNDLLFIRVNGSRQLVAKCIWVDREYQDVAFNDHLIRVQTNSQVENHFLKYVFSDDYIRSKLLSFIPFAPGGQLTINQTSLESIEIPVPPLPEQRKIAHILGTWDEAIAATEKLIAALQRRKQGLMQRLLTGQVRFREFAGSEWESQRIGNLLKEVSRPVEWDDEQEYELLSIRRRSGGIFLREIRRGSEIATKQMNVAYEGDFLISKMQIVHGASALTTHEYHGKHISNSYIALIVRDAREFDIRFFDWLSKTRRLYRIAYVSSNGVHIEKMSFNLNDYLDHTVRIPPGRREQEKVIETLQSAQNEIVKLGNCICQPQIAADDHEKSRQLAG